MEQVHIVRHKHFTEGQSVRQIARDMGLNRRTVRKYLSESEPQRDESVIRRQPVISVVGPRIEALLAACRTLKTRFCGYPFLKCSDIEIRLGLPETNQPFIVA